MNDIGPKRRANILNGALNDSTKEVESNMQKKWKAGNKTRDNYPKGLVTRSGNLRSGLSHGEKMQDIERKAGRRQNVNL